MGCDSGSVVEDTVCGPGIGVGTASTMRRRSTVVDGAIVDVVVVAGTDVVVAETGARTVVVVDGTVVDTATAAVVVTRGSVVRGGRRTVVVGAGATVVDVVVVVDVDDVVGLGGAAGDGTVTAIDRVETSMAVCALPAVSVIENDPEAVSVAVTAAPPAVAVDSAVTVQMDDEAPTATEVIDDRPAVSTKSADVSVEQSSGSSPVTVNVTDAADAVVGAVNVSVGAVASRVIVVVALTFVAGPVLPTASAICPDFNRGMIVPDEHDDTVMVRVVPDDALGVKVHPVAVPAFSKSALATPVTCFDITKV